MVYCLRSRSLGSEKPAAIYGDFNLLDDIQSMDQWIISFQIGVKFIDEYFS